MNYTVLKEVSSEFSYPNGNVWIMLIALLAIILLTIGLWWKKVSIYCRCVFVFGILFIAWITACECINVHRFKTEYHDTYFNGCYEELVGTVENYEAHNGDGMDLFTVNGIHFGIGYDDSVEHVGVYLDTRYGDKILHNGVNVRIRYIRYKHRNVIMKLELQE